MFLWWWNLNRIFLSRAQGTRASLHAGVFVAPGASEQPLILPGAYQHLQAMSFYLVLIPRREEWFSFYLGSHMYPEKLTVYLIHVVEKNVICLNSSKFIWNILRFAELFILHLLWRSIGKYFCCSNVQNVNVCVFYASVYALFNYLTFENHKCSFLYKCLVSAGGGAGMGDFMDVLVSGC